MTRRSLRGTRLPKQTRGDKDAQRLTRAVHQHHAGDPAGALAHYRRALLRDLNNPTALYFAALAKDQLGHDRKTAIPYMVKCLQLLHPRAHDPSVAPLFADASFNLGKFYLSAGKEEDAFVAYMAALEHNDQHIEALVGCGDHYWSLGQREAALGCWQAAIATPPRCPEAAHYRSFARLRFGDPGGWDDYEARWQCKMFVHTYGRPEYARIPLWTGDQSVDGRRIIVHGEQGHGDVIQCARYLGMLRDAGAEVVLEAHKPLVRLLRHSFPWATVFERETLYPEAVDLHVPSFSLPHRFSGANPNAPYLVPEAGFDRSPLDRLRVAVCWRGSKTHSNDRNRSCDVSHLAPLWTAPNVEYVSLQVGDAAGEADGTPMQRVDDQITDFSDTAEIIAHCDLVLTVDTAVAHLAGALGARVWMMTPPLSEWRWGLADPTTPLYPSMRIFRQPTKGDWAGVVSDVTQALTQWAEGR